LRKGISWDQANVIDLIVNIPTPEDCQALCRARQDCQGCTWLDETSDFYPLSCGIFSAQSEDRNCPHCVSGDPVCSCRLEGECISHEDNMIQAHTQVLTPDECEAICKDSLECAFFTYYGETNFLSHLCLLYKACDNVDETCQDCVIGVSECQICSFENTMNGTCIGCTEGWSQFGESCYKLIDNDGQHYYGKKECEEDCHLAGGQLASIHSEEENDFVYSLLRPIRLGTEEQDTYIGTEIDDEYNLYWSDETPWDYDNWNSGYPNIPNLERSCVYLGYDPKNPKKWVTGSCLYSRTVFDCMCKI